MKPLGTSKANDRSLATLVETAPDDHPELSIETFWAFSVSGTIFRSMLESSLVAGSIVSRTPAPLAKLDQKRGSSGLGGVRFGATPCDKLQRAADLGDR